MMKLPSASSSTLNTRLSTTVCLMTRWQCGICSLVRMQKHGYVSRTYVIHHTLCRLMMSHQPSVSSGHNMGDALLELSSNHIIHGGPQLIQHLSCLFTFMLSHGYTPPSMNLSSLCPITKSAKKSANDISNYRAIALGSVFAKVLDHIIMFKCKPQLCTSDLQFGFKEKSSTTQCTFVLNEIVDLYTRNSSSVHVILLDASQAFDRIDYCKLFQVLEERSVCPLILRFLTSMYTTQSLRVKWGNSISSSFSCIVTE